MSFYQKDRDMSEGSTDTPRMITSRTMTTVEPYLLSCGVCQHLVAPDSIIQPETADTMMFDSNHA